MRATYAPVTVDGVTTSNGAVVINGKTYISQDALTARGLTVLKPNSYGLYRFPNSQGIAVSLKGCLAETLFNGAQKLKINAPTWNASDRAWNIPFILQTPLQSTAEADQFGVQQMIAVYKSGRVFQPAKDRLLVAEMRVDAAGFPARGALNPGRIILRNPEDDGTDPPIKLVIPGGSARGTGTGTLTFDLTCTK